MTDTSLPDAVAEHIDTDAVPESYSEIRDELDWMIDEVNGHGASFVDIADTFAGEKTAFGHDEQFWTFEKLLERVADNIETCQENLDADQWDVLVRQLHILVALKEKPVEHHYKQKVKGEKLSGEPRVRGRVTARVYQLTEKSQMVFAARTYFLAMSGSTSYEVAFPRDVDAWFDREYGDFLDREEVAQMQADATDDITDEANA